MTEDISNAYWRGKTVVSKMPPALTSIWRALELMFMVSR
jgi:hypothetical protein